ncbi:Protein of unknown function DUF408 [Penicillium chermesinum]|uniref:RNA polymerase II subunit B1 CTD phosphatase RPAP2 homolog n=1 Tax=Penicillium chermesinum TaxID=63820 RepID=A0A9W9NZH5_9EURO|nr:Protein of unknown function DUF408 [Penicillium chermesinum]KAJ5232574.1 Protein of unknown function DUF408 [Penicillium chermesinum]KAJ6172231.1 Protein of unknown function DUF408 [Penicillium chermesinum]
MATPPAPAKSPLKTSLPSAFAAVSAEQPPAPQPFPSQDDQEKYLQNRPGANAHHLSIAMQHAHQIQAQKESENMILDRTIELLELPTSSAADPANPVAPDVLAFKTALSVFRPSDYDNLILERNYEDLCGYGLCPRKNRKQGNLKGNTFHFKWGAKGSGPGGRGRSMDIVPREDLEKWCSDECGERALFIRVQLAEEPVWARRATDARGSNITLLEEERAKLKSKRKAKGKGKAPDAADVVAGLEDLKIQEPSHSHPDVVAGLENLNIQDPDRSRKLAVERGDSAIAFRDGRVDIHIQENENASRASASAPQLRPEDALGGSIEGREKDSATLDGPDLFDQI